MNAREFLENEKIAITTEIDARKEKIGESEAWQLLKDGSLIYIGSRGKYSQWRPDSESRQEILSQAIGRSGNLRAPTLKIGDIFLIGFSEEMYRLIL